MTKASDLKAKAKNATEHIKAHMEVLGLDGMHVGTVDRLEGPDRIKLAKADTTSDGKHHFIPLGWVAHVDSHVHLNKLTRDAMAQWQAAA